jgi:hypothetical protein
MNNNTKFTKNINLTTKNIQLKLFSSSTTHIYTINVHLISWKLHHLIIASTSSIEIVDEKQPSLKTKKNCNCQILEEHYNKINQDFIIETKFTQYIQKLHTKNNTNTLSSCNSFENKQNAHTIKLENNLKVFFPPNLL